MRLVQAAAISALLLIPPSVGCVHRSPNVHHEFDTRPLNEYQADLRGEIRNDVEELSVGVGPRSGAQSLKNVLEAEAWIIARLQEMGLKPSRHVVDLGGIEVANVEVVIPGTELAEEIIVIGGHYDTVADSPGANDNASGVALLLATAKRLKEQPMARTVRVLFFVNEENPFTGGVQMGSRVYAERCRARGDDIVLMISIDSIGYYDNESGSQRRPLLASHLFPSTGNFVAFLTNGENQELLDFVVGVFQKETVFPSIGVAMDNKSIYVSDHAPFLWQGYPALLMSDTSEGRDPHYHKPTDVAGRLHYDALARVTDGFIRTVRTLAATETSLP